MPYNKPKSNNRGQFSRGPRGGRPTGGNRGGRKGGPKKQNIDKNLFINKETTAAHTIEYTPTHTFSDFGFSPKLQANVDATGFTAPSAIQDQTIPLAMEGKDVIGLANTGTGKTAAFLLPILQKLSRKPARSSVLIVAPTRELAQQIDAEFRKFSAGMKLYSATCVGGVNQNGQLRQLQRGPQIIIGTPGRLKDFVRQRVLDLSHVDTFVLDEADRMLDMGFVNDIREIAGLLPRERQTLCFSATMSPAIKLLTQDFMHMPETVSVKVTETNTHIYQDIVHFDNDDHKKELLVDMLSQADFEKVIVFGETKFGVQRLSDKLDKMGITSRAIHGNKSQSQRNSALNSFKTNNVKVLVATDVAARGLDIPNVSHVINYDTPQSYDDYVHRIGRTGRGGKTGKAFTFIKQPR